MNENFNQICEQEKVISLPGLAFYLLGKWKVMLAAALVLGVAACALFTFKDYKAYENTSEMTAEQELEAKGVTEEQKAIVRMKMGLIDNYEEVIKEYEYYFDNSIKVKLDPNSVNQGTITYVISAEDAEEVLKAAVICEEQIFSEEAVEELAQMLSEPTDAALLKEVIKFERNYAVDSVAGRAGINTDMEFKIVVRHFNEDDCTTMLEFAEEKMEAFPEILARENVAVNAAKISTNQEQIFDRSIAPLSKDVKAAIEYAYEEISLIKKHLSDEQRLYYDYLMELEENEAEETAEEASFIQFLNVKMAVAGAVAGAFCVAALYVVFYLLNGRIHNMDELKPWMPAPVMDGKSGMEMAAVVLKGVIANKQVKRLYLTGTSAKFNTAAMKELKELLSSENCEIIAGDHILKDAKAFQAATECGNIVLFETCDVSKEKDICEVIRKASACGIQILGVVLE